MATTNRGFTVGHQKIALELDLSGRLRARTELTVVPTRLDLRTVYLHSQGCSILSASHPANPAAGEPRPQPLDFSYLAPPPATVGDPKNLRLFPEAKRRLYESLNAADEGELAIAIDPAKVKRALRSSATPRDGPTPAAETPAAAGGPQKDKDREPEYEPIGIVVEYEVSQAGSGDGICVVSPTDAEPQRVPHVFTNTSTPTAARSWVPCVDSLFERSTWELDFVVPRAVLRDDGVEGARGEEVPLTVVASGELLEQVAHPHTTRKSVWRYLQPVATSVQHIAWAVGPFEMVDLSTATDGGGGGEDDDEDEAGGARQTVKESTSLLAFCLPGRTAELKHSAAPCAKKAFQFYADTYGSYPFSSYKLVFLDCLDSPTSAGAIFTAATLSLLPADLLHPADVIDPAYETRPAIAQTIAAQWSGINIIPKAWSDVWLVTGLQLYMTALFVRHLWGNNEYRFRLKRDVERCVALDFRMPPLCQPGMPAAPDADVVPFVNLKAPLVLYILDKHLRKAGTSLGLSRVIPKLFLSAISGELRDNTLSTSAFLRMCRRVAGGGDLRAWAEQWIYSNGCPHFAVTANFNRKRMVVELVVRQESRAKTYYELMATEEERATLKPNPVFEGQMTIRIHEADGTPYEHIIEIREQVKRHDLPFNTKYKRVRRNTKRFQARQAAAVAAAAGDADAVEELGMMDLSFAHLPWEEQPAERDRWRVADWTEEDDQVMSQATYEWCRLDAEFDWLASAELDQPDFMWIEQLQRDRDVVAQLDAVRALARLPSAIASTHLCKVVLVTSYFYRVRTEAALALAHCATEKLDYIGLFHLLKLFQTRYCYEPQAETLDPLKIRCIPRPTDFSNLAEYFIRKAILVSLARVRTPHRQGLPTVHQFFVDQLAFNDGALNPRSDTHYLAVLAAAAAHCYVDVDVQDQSEFFRAAAAVDPMRGSAVLAKTVDELDRLAYLDQLVPSFQNAITVAVIQCKLKLTLAGLIPIDMVFFLQYTREGNYSAVRIAAFDALLLLKAIQDKAIVRYLFIVLRDDECLLVRRRLAQGLLQSLPILVAMEELGREDGDRDDFEEDETELARAAKTLDSKAVVRSLRHEVGRAVILRECISAVMLAPDMDLDVQCCLLKICETLLKPQDESVPKVRLRMPTNSALFQSDLPTPSVPKVKLTLGTMPPPDVPGIPPKESPRLVLKPKQPFDLASAPPAKPPKPAKKQKFEASGMNLTDYKACQKLLKKIVSFSASLPFRVAVDPIRDNAPDYFNVIEEPMDLGTMGQKLESGQYSDRLAFKHDFELIIANCKLYNLAESPMVVKYANPFKVSFDKQWYRSEKTIESLQAKAAAAMRPPPAPSASSSRPAPPPSFADFAAGTDQLPQQTSASVSRPGGLKLTLKSRPSESGASARPGSLKIKFGGTSTASTPAVLVESPAATSIYPPASSYFPPIPPGAELAVNRNPKKKKSTKLRGGDFTGSTSSSQTVSPAIPQKAALYPPPDDDDPDADGSLDGDVGHVPLAAIPIGPPPATDLAELDLDEGKDEPLNQKKAKTVLRRVAESESGVWFRQPVDPVALGIPTYLDEIAEPMDLGTMQKKLEMGKYKKESQLFRDFNLIVRNCVQFNGLSSAAGQAAVGLGEIWKAECERAKKIGYAEKRSLLGLLGRLSKVPGADVFATAVDPVALGIPTYFDAIGGPENARDLGTIRAKLDADGFETVDEVEEDVRQMLRNCYSFNPPDNIIYLIGKDVERQLDQGIVKIRKDAGLPPSSALKRKGDGSSGSVAKKVRLA